MILGHAKRRGLRPSMGNPRRFEMPSVIHAPSYAGRWVGHLVLFPSLTIRATYLCADAPATSWTPLALSRALRTTLDPTTIRKKRTMIVTTNHRPALDA